MLCDTYAVHSSDVNDALNTIKFFYSKIYKPETELCYSPSVCFLGVLKYIKIYNLWHHKFSRAGNLAMYL